MAALTTISWTPTANAKDAVNHALFAGYQSDGKSVYVGKVQDEEGNFIPAKIVPEENKIFFEQGGEEKDSERMEYLFHNEGYEWLKSSNGRAVPDAVLLSNNYIGRAEIDGTTVVGRVDLESKQLIASYYGKILNLSDYDVLVFKPQTNKTRFQQAVKVSKERYENFYNDIRSDSSMYSERIYRENSFNQQKFLELQNRIQSLELELSNYKNDRKNYEARIAYEQKRVQEMSEKVQGLRFEKSTIIQERSSFEERLSFESTKINDLELKLRDYINENELLLKKVSNLEDTLRSERYQLETYSEKFRSIQTGGNGGSRMKTFEEKVKSQQQRIFELELLIETVNADTDSFKSQLTSYESTIDHQKIQIESILKKMQNANADNEFLVKKLSLLQQTLSNYKYEIESMTGQLQNAKGLIAQLTAELARANGQLAKFQAALSNSYILNGELMTKVSGLSSLSQYQSSFDSKFDMLSVNLNSIEASSKAYTYNTPSLLEATGSETYMRYIRASSSGSEREVNSDVETGFTPYTPADDKPVPIKPL
ncbi:unnamed protein product [Chironomus riparius]|uniref:Uncharacterized protein n=1 Tax=Chironomus riparius TaxID=315576 RepID=A0A9N9WM31_9DIPT|nr:unnamed protein product [Chironomus riparius]